MATSRRAARGNLRAKRATTQGEFGSRQAATLTDVLEPLRDLRLSRPRDPIDPDDLGGPHGEGRSSLTGRMRWIEDPKDESAPEVATRARPAERFLTHGKSSPH